MAKYQQIEYIGCTSEQWIDTGVIPNNTICIEGDIFPRTNGDLKILGVIGPVGLAILSGYWRVLSNGGYSLSDVAAKSSKVHIRYFDSRWYIGDSQIEAIWSGYTTDTVSLGRITGDLYPYYGYIYPFKFWKDGVLIRNFIPCYRTSDNVAGLFDIVEGTFYVNAGTGTFTKGPDISTSITFSKNGTVTSAEVCEISSGIKVDSFGYIQTTEILEI